MLFGPKFFQNKDEFEVNRYIGLCRIFDYMQDLKFSF